MRTASLLAFGAFLCATPALADGQIVSKLTAPIVDPHTWYVTFGAGAEVTNLQKWDILWNDTSGVGNPIGFGDNQLGFGTQFTLGHVFGQQLDPQLWGGRLHISASGSYFDGSVDSTIRSSDGIDVDMLTLSAGAILGMDDPQSVDFTSDYSGFAAEFRAGLDFVAGEGFLVTPSVSVFGGATSLTQTAVIEETPDDPLPNYFDRLSQDIDTTNIGATIGLGGSYAMGGGFYLKAGAEVGVAYTSANGTISQCYTFAMTNGGCVGPTETVEMETSGAALVAGGGLGVDYDIGFAVIGLAVQANYDGTTASFDYPDFPGDTVLLERVGSWSYGGGITVTVPLN